MCRESRRQVGRKVRVEAETPRSLWHGCGGSSSSSTDEGARTDTRPAAAGPAAVAGSGSRKGRKFSWHGSITAAASAGAARTTPSPAAASTATTAAATTTPTTTAPPIPPPPSSPLTGTPATRVPRIRCVRIDWLLPVASQLLSPGFEWPRGVIELRFGPLFQDGIERLTLPETLETLTFGFRFNRSLGPGRVRWPPRLRRLKLGATWNRLLSGARTSWPPSLEVLEFGTGFDKPLQGGGGDGDRDRVGLPPGLRAVDLGGVFNQALAGVEWPPGLQELTLSEFFNQPLEFRDGGKGGVSFPAGLRRIVFGGQFNQEVSSTAWPGGLQFLAFGDKFNRAFVPPGAEPRGFPGGGGGGGGGGGPAAREPVPSSPPFPPRSFALPAGLKALVLGDDYDHPMSEGELPDGLERLVIGKSYSFLPSVRWPAALKRLELSCRWGGGGGGGGGDGGGAGVAAGGGYRAPQPWLILPPRLVYLNVGDGFNSPLDRIAFPASLRVLVLGSAFDHPIDHAASAHALAAPAESLPSGSLPAVPADVPAASGAPEEPQGLRRRQRQRQYLLLPPPILPDGLEELQLGRAFNRHIETARLPKRLKRLVFSLDSQFDLPVAGVAWPPELEELHFGNCFNQRVEAGGSGFGGGGGGGGGDVVGGADLDSALMLPSGLRELSFGWSFSHSLQGVVLPRGLRRLCFAPMYPPSHVRGLEWPPSLQCIVVGLHAFRSREQVFKWASQPMF